jgi:hypothetical protein
MLLLAGCHGSGGAKAPPVPAADFALSLSAPTLSVVTGGSGFLTVNLQRLNGFTGAVALALENPPVGLVATGSLGASENSGRVNVGVVSGTAPKTFSGLILKGSSGTLSHTASFTLTITSVAATLSVDQVQAAGLLQRGGTGENRSVVGEATTATSAQTAGSNPSVNRPGYAPVAH